uniref:Uncharacterized protein n=1 Tax=Pristionchus pacificus TaxID=54126 RepID=A0A2A6D2R6_PRIPA
CISEESILEIYYAPMLPPEEVILKPNIIESSRL